MIMFGENLYSLRICGDQDWRIKAPCIVKINRDCSMNLIVILWQADTRIVYSSIDPQ